MNFIKKLSFFALLVTAMLETNLFSCAKGWRKNKNGVCVKNGTLDRASILNEYPADISIQLQWRNEHGTHNRFNTNEIVKRNRHNTFKAPFLGYELEKITVTPTAIAAGIGTGVAVGSLAILVGVSAAAPPAAAAGGAAAGGAAGGGTSTLVGTSYAPASAAGIVAFDGIMKARKNRYFVVNRSQNKVQGTSTPKLVITAYKNQAEYKASKGSKNPDVTNIDESELSMEI